MKIHDDTYEWDGWGGEFKLGSGKCRLKIFDLRKDTGQSSLMHMKPIIVVVSDIRQPRLISQMTVKSCAGHVATCVIEDFNIKPNRMMWVEHYPSRTYGAGRRTPERFDLVEFTWEDGRALFPKWREPNIQSGELFKSLVKIK